MKRIERYHIELASLKEGTHTFKFAVSKNLFESFDQEMVSDASASVQVRLVKTSQMLQLTLNAKGWLELECDRTLNRFRYPIEFEKALLYKFGEEYKELTDNVLMIPKGLELLDLNQVFYDYLMLQVPMRKLHPDVEQESEEWLLRDTSSTEGDTIDPRWSKLKELSNQ